MSSFTVREIAEAAARRGALQEKLRVMTASWIPPVAAPDPEQLAAQAKFKVGDYVRVHRDMKYPTIPAGTLGVIVYADGCTRTALFRDYGDADVDSSCVELVGEK